VFALQTIDAYLVAEGAAEQIALACLLDDVVDDA
jgi:hypothetical protein